MPTKTWVVGEEVLAADFNTFVQKQVVATFANSAARTAALPAPTAGMQTWLDDVKRMEVWDGAKWVGTRVAGLAKQTGTVSVPMSAETMIPMGVVEYSVGGITISGGQVVVPVGGLYLFTGSLGSINGTGNAPMTGMVQTILNPSAGGALKNSAKVESWFPNMTVSQMAVLPAGGTCSLAVYNGMTTAGFSDPTGGAGQASKIGVQLVGPS